MSICSGLPLSTLCADVQFNCALSDARYAREYSLCIYLLRMREYYRWCFDIPLTQALDPGVVGQWMADTESYWDDIEEQEFRLITIDGITFDPFESDSINAQLSPRPVIYSAGVGRLGQPHFMLAELLELNRDEVSMTYECGRELARDSITLPAMTQDQTIFVRHDSIKRHLWQMLEEWRLQKPDGPMARIVRYYQLDDHNAFAEKLDRATAEIIPLYREHERGEIAAGRRLDKRFHMLVQHFIGSRNEFYLRAIRDILADTLTTWPYIVANGKEIVLDFWLASLSGARHELLNATEISTLFNEHHSECTRLESLAKVVESEQSRWTSIVNSILSHNKSDHDAADIKAQALALLNDKENALT